MNSKKLGIAFALSFVSLSVAASSDEPCIGWHCFTPSYRIESGVYISDDYFRSMSFQVAYWPNLGRYAANIYILNEHCQSDPNIKLDSQVKEVNGQAVWFDFYCNSYKQKYMMPASENGDIFLIKEAQENEILNVNGIFFDTSGFYKYTHNSKNIAL